MSTCKAADQFPARLTQLSGPETRRRDEVESRRQYGRHGISRWAHLSASSPARPGGVTGGPTTPREQAIESNFPLPPRPHAGQPGFHWPSRWQAGDFQQSRLNERTNRVRVRVYGRGSSSGSTKPPPLLPHHKRNPIASSMPTPSPWPGSSCPSPLRRSCQKKTRESS